MDSMKTLLALSWIIFVVGTGAGCAGGTAGASRPIPLKDALAILQQDLRDVAPVTLTDVGGVGEGELRVINEIGMEQCKQDTANPLMPVLNGPLNLQLFGQFQIGGEIGFSVTAPVSLTVSAGVNQQQGQQIAVPISFVALAGLADFHFGQDMANFSNLPDNLKTAQATELLRTREKIRTLTRKLMESYPTSLKPRCAEVKAGAVKASALLKPVTQG